MIFFPAMWAEEFGTITFLKKCKGGTNVKLLCIYGTEQIQDDEFLAT